MSPFLFISSLGSASGACPRQPSRHALLYSLSTVLSRIAPSSWPPIGTPIVSADSGTISTTSTIVTCSDYCLQPAARLLDAALERPWFFCARSSSGSMHSAVHVYVCLWVCYSSSLSIIYFLLPAAATALPRSR
ncbi:hypothetical protein BV20DRAFT_965644 [Pilatotrama ljubarskyi]|nr:hypothetical protein BV20DRAFT_965644 [Pilatotrama ljubarskyi]